MIHGLGLDLIEIERIAQALKRHGSRFTSRLFTERECIRHKTLTEKTLAIHVAGRFAAKEAVVKALGTGFSGIDWKEIEILNDALGKPVVILHEKLHARFKNPQLLITITHSKSCASAFCIWIEGQA